MLINLHAAWSSNKVSITILLFIVEPFPFYFWVRAIMKVVRTTLEDVKFFIVKMACSVLVGVWYANLTN